MKNQHLIVEINGRSNWEVYSEFRFMGIKFTEHHINLINRCQKQLKEDKDLFCIESLIYVEPIDEEERECDEVRLSAGQLRMYDNYFYIVVDSKYDSNTTFQSKCLNLIDGVVLIEEEVYDLENNIPT